ncbi:MAG: hypothetical protein MJK04_32470, partial [Psychrosphaera sp.]|nr:hypothetical protein [Psychrosphaera sp.]
MIREIYLTNKYKLLLSIVTSVMNSLLTLYVISAITSAIIDIDGLSGNSDAVMILVAIASLFVLNFTAAVVLSDLNTSTLSTLRTSLIHKMLSIDFIKKETLGVDKFYAALTLDIGKLSQFVCQIPVLLYNLVVVFLCLGYLFFLSWKMSAILLLSLGLLFSVYFFAANKGYLSYIKLRDIEDKLFASFDIMMSGGKELSINQNRKAHYFHQQAVPAAQNRKAAEHKAMHYWIFAESWMMASLFVCLFAIVFIGGTVLQMQGQQLVQIAMIFLFVLMPMKALSQGFGALSQAKVSLDKIASLELMEQNDGKDELVFKQVDKASDFSSL